MGSASDVNRSPAIGHARSPGQSADWPHYAPSMTRADAVSRGSVSVWKRVGVNAKASRVTRRAASRGTLSGRGAGIDHPGVVSQSSRSRKGIVVGGTRRRNLDRQAKVQMDVAGRNRSRGRLCLVEKARGQPIVRGRHRR